MGRVQLLYLALYTGDDAILDQLCGAEMTLLRNLRFANVSNGLRLSASMMEKISSLGVNITKLLLWNIDTHMSSLTFPRLLHFRCITEVGFRGPRISDMIGFLRGHPMLEELELDRVNYSYAVDVDTRIEPVALRHLEYGTLGGRSSSPSPDSLPYIEVDLLPYLLLPSAGQCDIWVIPASVAFPSGTNYLLTLIRVWEIISGPGGGFGEGTGFIQADFSINERPGTLTGQVELLIAGWGSLCISLENMVVDSRSWLNPDWETSITDEDPGAGEADDDESQAQLSRLGCYLDPLRWSPSPLATVESLFLRGFGYTRNKEKYLQYLRKCFVGLNRVREFQVDEANPGMVVHLLQPFEGESGGMVLLFPLLRLLSFYNCTPPQPVFLEVMKKRAGLGNVLEEALVDNVKVDLSELWDMQQRT